ncbi:hypothetical protein M8J77_002774 [Diaphorina citri]|nr:hypothetical protein M8J77_002774 [Diaphorina citri]
MARPDRLLFKYVCFACTYHSYNVGNFKTHARTHTGDKPFECYACGYKSANDLLIYTITADDGTLLRELGAAASNVESCTIADEGVLLSELCTAANNASLPVSNNTQPKPKAIICFHCKQTLPSDEDSLSKHCEECSSMARPNPLTYKFVCFGCNYYTYCRRIITNHYRKHTGRKPFKCVVCKQFFATYGGAYQHLRRTHGQESCSSLKALRKPRGPKPKPDSTRSLRKKK